LLGLVGPVFRHLFLVSPFCCVPYARLAELRVMDPERCTRVHSFRRGRMSTGRLLHRSALERCSRPTSRPESFSRAQARRICKKKGAL